MQRLGHTRSSSQADHALWTPDTFVRAPLPGMQNATAIVHAAPAMGASFTEYTAEFEAGGSLGPALTQRFLYVLDGELRLANGKQQRISSLLQRNRNSSASCPLPRYAAGVLSANAD